MATAMRMWTSLNRFTKKSRIYTPMPLYHSTAGEVVVHHHTFAHSHNLAPPAILAVAMAWNSGATIIIGRKFSATRFWFVVIKKASWRLASH
jgi:hypothetical protein